MFQTERSRLALAGLVLILIMFGLLYSDMIFSLPLFGDATIQGKVTKELLDGGALETNSTYPPAYSSLQAILFLMFGEAGMNSITLLGILLMAISVFLLVRELTGRGVIALLSAAIVLASPKVIFYSSRMYMEILLTGLFVFSIFLLLRYFKTRSNTYLALLILFSAAASAMKQQGLFILFPSVLLTLLILFLASRARMQGLSFCGVHAKQVASYALVFLLLILPAYLVVIHTSGEITQGSEEFLFLRGVNYIGQKIGGYELSSQDANFSQRWSARLEEVHRRYYGKGVQSSESRHVWPLDPLVSWNGFTSINGLYLAGFWGGDTSQALADLMNLLVVLGMVLFVLNILFKNRLLELTDLRAQRCFTVFLLSFIAINYALFIRNTDQMRYHLFIAVIFSMFSAIGIWFLFKVFILDSKFPAYAKELLAFLIILALGISLLSLAYEDASFNKRWYKSQVYGPSQGGIPSIQEAGLWLEQHTPKNASVWQMCGNEMAYYSNRRVVGDFTFYFLEKDELGEIFKDLGVGHIVIFDSMIVEDGGWKNLCWVPASFDEKIRAIYEEVYRTSFGDIRIYEV